MTRQGKVLVVEDNGMERHALSRWLDEHGFAVDVACDGGDALERLDRGTYDLVLLEIEMPVMDGLDVLETIRRTRSQTDLPVIMITGRTQGGHIVEAFRLGANDYVTKPIDYSIAAARIRTHLAHKRAIEDLQESEGRYALALRGSNDGIWDWNLLTNDVHWSAQWKAVVGCADQEVGATPDEWLDRIHPDDRAAVRQALSAHLTDGSAQFESEHRLLHRNGTYRWVRCRGAAVRNGAMEAIRLVGSLSDITETKVADALTGLPNRLLFIDLLDRAIKRTQRRPDYLFALLSLELTRFKHVRAGLGPVTADKLLVAVACRLQAALRGTDAIVPDAPGFTLARLGGDEFMVLLEDISDVSDAVRVAERLRGVLEQPFDVDGDQVYMSVAFGIAVSSTGYDRPDEILRDAATALHRSVASGRGSCELFDPEMRARAIGRLQLETDLRRSIADGAFVVHYQPIVTLRTGAIAGFEALVRWNHPTRGLVAPAEFILAAEDTGLLGPIGRLVLHQAARQMASWLKRFGPLAPDVMCVNVSCRQFAGGSFWSEVQAVLRETRIDSSHLHLEITESALMDDTCHAARTLDELNALGIGWSIDDFGTGYSSLSYLDRLQPKTVKVERSFVSRMGQGAPGSEMVAAIVALAHTLGMTVVAEGVETEEQLIQLCGMGCDFAQGYLFARPLDAPAAEQLIASQPWRSAAGPAALRHFEMNVPARSSA